MRPTRTRDKRMKKIMFTAFAVIALALTSFAGPHTKEYQDAKRILNEYEQNVNKATTCEDLENASMSLLFNLLSLVEVEYDENEAMTEQEEQEINEQMERIDKKVKNLQEQWGCETTEDTDDDTSEQSVKPTTTEEWESIINDFDALVKKMDKIKDLDFEDEDNLDELLEFIMEAQPLQERMDSADPETLTDRQAKRLEDLNDRFTAIAKQMGLIDEE